MRTRPSGLLSKPQRLRRRSARPRLEAMEDRLLLTIFQVVNTLDNANPGSLRWAIGQTTAGGGGDKIEFVIPGGGVRTISVGSALPAITKPVTLDGRLMPGYSGTPLVQLDGTAAGAGVNGLAITAGSTTVFGLSIGNFSGNGISLTTLGGNIIRGNYLGMRADGDFAAPNGLAGLFISNSGNNTVGGTLPGQGNLVSGNLGYGINLNIGDRNLFEGNLVGVDATASQKRGNAAGGIRVSLGMNNVIGGTTLAARNIIAGNGGHGIETFGVTDGLIISGNVIGTNDAHTLNLGNSGDGVHLFSSNTSVGGLNAGASNVIAFSRS